MGGDQFLRFLLLAPHTHRKKKPEGIIAMASKLNIVNSTLVKLGADPVDSLDTSSHMMTIINAQYDITKQNVLASHRWRWLMQNAELDLTKGLAGGTNEQQQIIISVPSNGNALQFVMKLGTQSASLSVRNTDSTSTVSTNIRNALIAFTGVDPDGVSVATTFASSTNKFTVGVEFINNNGAYNWAQLGDTFVFGGHGVEYSTIVEGKQGDVPLWDYSFDLPTGHLGGVNAVYYNTERPIQMRKSQFEIRGQTLRTNRDKVLVVYAANNIEEEKMPPSFVAYFVASLCYDCTFPTTDDKTLLQLKAGEVEIKRRNAIKDHNREYPARGFDTRGWERNFYGNVYPYDNLEYWGA